MHSLVIFLSKAVWKPGTGQSAGNRGTNKHSPAEGFGAWLGGQAHL